jgi:hypothetical protein
MMVGGRAFARELAITLLLLLCSLGACGRASAGPGAFTNARPDQVRITSFSVTGDPPSSVTVEQAETAQELLRAADALPLAPAQQICDAIAGPRYELTFIEGGRVVVVATADRGGCPSVRFAAPDTTPGASQDTRQANDAFWRLLARVVADATPPARPDRVVVVTFPATHQPATAATIGSPEPAQQLYDAILALPSLPPSSSCPSTRGPRHELAFFEGAKPIRATADRGGCSTAQVLPGSLHQADTAFWRLLDNTLASAASTPARPDRLDLKVEPVPGDPNGTAHATMVRDADLIQRLYAAVYALPALSPARTCIATVGAHYGLSFSLGEGGGGIELLAALADKGGCGTVDLGDGDVRLADGAFWGLVDRADRA